MTYDSFEASVLAAAWAHDVTEVADRLQVDPAHGLTTTDVMRRRAKFGANDLPQAKRVGPLRVLVRQFANVMTVVLVAAAAATVALGDTEDVGIILGVVVLNGLVGFLQEYRSEHAIRALHELATPFARIRRDGTSVRLPAQGLVPGDVLELDAGDVVAADVRVIEAAALSINESALTGESVPVRKTIDSLPLARVAVGDRTNMAFRGTAVVAGRGKGLVVATGSCTEVGKIAVSLGVGVRHATPLQERLAALGRRLALLALVVCAIVLAVGVASGESVGMMLLTAVTLAVAAVPEALPVVVTVALALGAQRMVKKQALIRRLAAVETLGCVNVICADKTGTLTEGHMAVERVVTRDIDETWPLDTPTPSLENPARALLLAGVLCNDAVLPPAAEAGAYRAIGDPTELALVEFARRAGFDAADIRARMPRVAEFPFDPDRRRMTTVHRASDGQFLVASKGAFDAMLPRVTAVASLTGKRNIDQADINWWNERARLLAEAGLRVLALAGRSLDHLPADMAAVENDLTLYGLVGIADAPRPASARAIAECRRAGITPVMITGDHPVTAAAIAARVGISARRVMTGVQLAGLSSAELQRQIADIGVFARTAPQQKLAIVRAWQARGAIVAMTGDGVNDAPALQQADIGIAMGRAGTDVAREASDMVLADDNFATIVGAVKEGRRIYDNIRRFVRFAIATNAAEIGVMLFAPLVGLPVPLLPVHILWVNLVTDGLPGIGLAMEAAEADVLDRPPRPRTEGLFAGGLWTRTLLSSGVMAAVALGLGAWGYVTGGHWQTMVFTTLALLQLTHALALRSDRRSLFRMPIATNPLLVSSVLLTSATQVGLIYWQPAQQMLHVESLSAVELGVVMVFSSAAFWVVEIEKWVARRRQ